MKLFNFILSDIHLGHDKYITEKMIYDLDVFFSTYKSDIIKAKVFYISGDVYDKLLSINSIESRLINKWLTNLIIFCIEYNIKLRILKGTTSHDWDQVLHLYTIIETLKLDIDFKYIDKLYIEHMEDFGIHVLYLPDEWKNDVNDTYKDILELLKKHKLKKVDMIIMHGGFKFQLPEYIHGLHDQDLYTKLAYGPIIAGHIHKRSIYKNIIIPGSFGQLSHNDDDDLERGGLSVIYDTITHDFTFKFYNNKNTVRFTSIDVKDKDIESIKKILDKYNKSKFTYFISLIVGENIQLKKSIHELRKIYPNINIDIVREKQKEEIHIKKNKIIIDTKKLDKITIEEHIFNKIENENTHLKHLILEELSNIL